MPGKTARNRGSTHSLGMKFDDRTVYKQSFFSPCEENQDEEDKVIKRNERNQAKVYREKQR